MTLDYLQDPIGSLYRRLIPAAIGSMLTATVASLIDTIILSNFLGPVMLSSVSLCMPIYMLLNALAMLVASGGATVYAFYIGKDDRDESNRYFTASTWTIVVIGALLMLVGLLFTDPIVRMLGANDAVYQSTYEYARVLMYFMIPLMLYSLLMFFVRFDSDPMLTLIATFVCAGVNLVLDILFVGPFGWGPAGAALATCLAYTIAMLTNALHFLKKKNTLRLMRGGFTFKRVIHSLKTGAPLSLSQFGMAVATSVFNIRIMLTGGEMYVTAYAIVTQLSMSAMAFYEGIAQAAQPIFAANLGAGNRERIQKTFGKGVTLELIFTGACMLLYVFGARIVSGFFAITDGELLNISMEAIRRYAFAIPFTGLNVLVMYYYQAQEKVAASISISLMHSTVLMIVGLLLLTALFGEDGIWWSWLFAETLTLVMSMLLLRFSKKSFSAKKA